MSALPTMLPGGELLYNPQVSEPYICLSGLGLWFYYACWTWKSTLSILWPMLYCVEMYPLPRHKPRSTQNQKMVRLCTSGKKKGGHPGKKSNNCLCTDWGPIRKGENSQKNWIMLLSIKNYFFHTSNRFVGLGKWPIQQCLPRNHDNLSSELEPM